MNRPAAGKLWIVATPIGNLDDISVRAREVLCAVDLIAAEDTRHSAALLRHIGSTVRTFALHEHNERAASDQLVERMREGAQIALISDAGTPLISDPGFRLVRAAREAGVVVSPVPGACAAIAALSVAGLPSDRFVFEGFLPAKSAARRALSTADTSASCRRCSFDHAVRSFSTSSNADRTVDSYVARACSTTAFCARTFATSAPPRKMGKLSEMPKRFVRSPSNTLLESGD